jgi:acyl-CoA synthetase (AMP-forming)/AMP-acid ligase II
VVSGTTGLPKAAKIKHSRFFVSGASFALFHAVTGADRLYCSLPLYHSAGGMLGVSISWFSGAALVLRYAHP